MNEELEVKAAGLSMKIKSSVSRGATEYYFRHKQGRTSKKVSSRSRDEIVRLAKTVLEGIAAGKVVDPKMDALAWGYYRDCEKLLAGRVPLREAVQYWLDNHEENRFLQTTRSIVDLFYEERKETKREDGTPRYSRDYLSSMRSQLQNKLCKRFGPKPLSEISKTEIEVWLNDRREFPSAVYAQNVLCLFRVLCNWAQAQGLLDTAKPHAASFAKPPHAALKEPDLITPGDLRILCERAVELDDKRVLGTLVLKAFVGMRDAEVLRVTWDQVDLDDGALSLGRQHTKTKRGRRIELTPQVAGLLRYCHAHRGQGGRGSRRRNMVGKPSPYRVLRELRYDDNGIEDVEVTKNCLRHSFVTYARILGGDVQKIAETAGHTVKVGSENYTASGTKAEAKEYFGITIESLLGQPFEIVEKEDSAAA